MVDDRDQAENRKHSSNVQHAQTHSYQVVIIEVVAATINGMPALPSPIYAPHRGHSSFPRQGRGRLGRRHCVGRLGRNGLDNANGGSRSYTRDHPGKRESPSRLSSKGVNQSAEWRGPMVPGRTKNGRTRRTRCHTQYLCSTRCSQKLHNIPRTCVFDRGYGETHYKNNIF